MVRWWTGAEPARRTLALVDGSDLSTEVGIAVLGLHGMGVEEVSKGAADDEALRARFAQVGTDPVAQAWSVAFDSYVDDPDVYASGRVADLKSDADAGASTVVRSLTSAGVSWPLAVQRAGAAYGLPPKDAASYARKVAAPVLPPAVVDHEADAALAAYAARVGALEVDLVPENSSPENSHAGEPVQKAAAAADYHGKDPGERDDRGRFASAGSDGGGDEAAVARRKRRKKHAAVAARRRQAAARPAAPPRSRAAEAAGSLVSGFAAEAAAVKAAEEKRMAQLRARLVEQNKPKATEEDRQAEGKARRMVRLAIIREAQRNGIKAATAEQAAAEMAQREAEGVKVTRESEKIAAQIDGLIAAFAPTWDNEDEYQNAVESVRDGQAVVTLSTSDQRFSMVPKVIVDSIAAPSGPLAARASVGQTFAAELESKVAAVFGPSAQELLLAHTTVTLSDQLSNMVSAGEARQDSDDPDQWYIKDLAGRWQPMVTTSFRGATLDLSDDDLQHPTTKAGGKYVIEPHVARPYSAGQRFLFEDVDSGKEDVLVDADVRGQLRGLDVVDLDTGSRLTDSRHISAKALAVGVDKSHDDVLWGGKYHDVSADADIVTDYPPATPEPDDDLLKADREYHGDDPDERDERGRFAAKGAGGDPTAVRRRRARAQAASSRRRRSAAPQPQRRVITPPATPAPGQRAPSPASSPAQAPGATETADEKRTRVRRAILRKAMLVEANAQQQRIGEARAAAVQADLQARAAALRSAGASRPIPASAVKRAERQAEAAEAGTVGLSELRQMFGDMPLVDLGANVDVINPKQMPNNVSYHVADDAVPENADLPSYLKAFTARSERGKQAGVEDHAVVHQAQLGALKRGVQPNRPFGGRLHGHHPEPQESDEVDASPEFYFAEQLLAVAVEQNTPHLQVPSKEGQDIKEVADVLGIDEGRLRVEEIPEMPADIFRPWSAAVKDEPIAIILGNPKGGASPGERLVLGHSSLHSRTTTHDIATLLLEQTAASPEADITTEQSVESRVKEILDQPPIDIDLYAVLD